MNHNFKIGDTVKLKTHDNIMFSVSHFPTPKNSNNAMDLITEGVYDEDYIVIKRYDETTDKFNYQEVHYNEITLWE